MTGNLTANAPGTKDGTSVVTPTALKEAVERVTSEARRLRTRKERGEYAPLAWGQDIIDANNALADAMDTLAATLSSQAESLEAMASALENIAGVKNECGEQAWDGSKWVPIREIARTTLTQYRQGGL